MKIHQWVGQLVRVRVPCLVLEVGFRGQEIERNPCVMRPRKTD